MMQDEGHTKDEVVSIGPLFFYFLYCQQPWDNSDMEKNNYAEH